MLITNHVLHGALIGRTNLTVPQAVVAGIAAHFAADAVPHYGLNVGYSHDEFYALAKRDGLTGLTVVAATLLVAPKEDRLRTAAGIFGTCLPDLNKPAAEFFGRSPFPRTVDHWHGVIQTEHPSLWKTEAIAATVAVGVLTAITLRRKRKARRAAEANGMSPLMRSTLDGIRQPGVIDELHNMASQQAPWSQNEELATS
jgi:hypothetical protein